jgi:iron complex outermembrane recepter protein
MSSNTLRINCGSTPYTRRTALALALLASLPNAAMASSALEEIVVTAQKREQSLQEVGISVSAFAGDDITRLGLNDIDQLTAIVPNLQSLDDAAGLTSFRIRGIGLNEFQAAFDSPVGIHVDEFFLSKPMLASLGFFDVDRIEVLKGPQGTVFGRNTTGGAVNYYSKRPGDEFEAGISVSYGNFQRLSTEAAVGGPLAQGLNGRIAAQWIDHGDDGQYRNLYSGDRIGELEQQQLRGQLEWTGGDTRILGTLEYGSKDGDLTPYDNIFQDQPGGLPDVTAVIRDPISRETVNQDYWPRTDSDYRGASLRLDHEFELGTLSSLTGYKGFERDNREDSDNTPYASTNIDWYADITQITQELRLAGERENWHYLLGAYVENNELSTVETVDVSTVWALGLAGFAQLGADHEMETQTWALFTTHEFALSERLALVLGGRYTEETNEIRGQSFLTLAPSASFGNQNEIAAADRVVLVDADSERTDSDVNYKIGLNFQLNDDVLLYTSFSTGFRSGGYDLAFGSPSLITFEPEDVAAWEAGFKSAWLDNTLTFNAAAFFTTVDDYQNNVNFANELVPRRRNVGTLETSGLEADLKWQPVERLRIMLSAGYTDSEIARVSKDDSGAPFAIDGVPIKGNQEVNTPEWSFGAIADYVHPLNERMELQLLANWSWSDERYLELENGPDHLVDAYSTIDASIAVAEIAGKWRVSAWGKNLGDEDYLRYINDVPGFGLFLTINAEPRTYGLKFEYAL